MSQPQFDDLTALLRPVRAALPSGATLDIKHFFSGAAAYADGRICISLTPVGLAMKLDAADGARLLAAGGGPLRYFSNAPVKKGYVLCPPELWGDAGQVMLWARKSIDYVLTLPAPKPQTKRRATRS